MKKKFLSILIGVALVVGFLLPGLVYASNWVTPTGHNDPDTQWTVEEKAYDG